MEQGYFGNKGKKVNNLVIEEESAEPKEWRKAQEEEGVWRSKKKEIFYHERLDLYILLWRICCLIKKNTFILCYITTF